MPNSTNRRPPFESRSTSVRKAWRWYRQLEALGVDNARMRLALQSESRPARFPDPDIPIDFVQDWLSYHDRKSRREAAFWLVAALIAVVVLTIGLIMGPQPAL